MNNLDVFKNTLSLIQQNKQLSLFTRNCIQQTRYFPPCFFSQSSPDFNGMSVSFQENLTLITARALAESGKKVAVLNFANPVEPGGGVLRGADAQEEYLCRASNLYQSLTSDNAAQFYELHRSILRKNQRANLMLGTSAIVYSPNVTFFKEDVGYRPGMKTNPTQHYTYRWFHADVITCAAPIFSETSSLPCGDLEYLFIQRIRNIFETAIENRIDALVAGAFGCGAFHNPPEIVASAFRSVLMEERYSHAFSDVVFAVRATGAQCPNIKAFRDAFTNF